MLAAIQPMREIISRPELFTKTPDETTPHLLCANYLTLVRLWVLVTREEINIVSYSADRLLDSK